MIAEATDGRELLDLAQQKQPDVILLDIIMPGFNWIQAIRRLQTIAERTKIVVISMHATEEYIVSALNAGALSYLLKDAPSRRPDQGGSGCIPGAADPARP